MLHTYPDSASYIILTNFPGIIHPKFLAMSPWDHAFNHSELSSLWTVNWSELVKEIFRNRLNFVEAAWVLCMLSLGTSPQNSFYSWYGWNWYAYFGVSWLNSLILSFLTSGNKIVMLDHFSSRINTSFNWRIFTLASLHGSLSLTELGQGYINLQVIFIGLASGLHVRTIAGSNRAVVACALWEGARKVT
jgi:hypothetical protein